MSFLASSSTKSWRGRQQWWQKWSPGITHWQIMFIGLLWWVLFVVFTVIGERMSVKFVRCKSICGIMSYGTCRWIVGCDCYFKQRMKGPERELFVRYEFHSYWDCNWISEIQVRHYGICHWMCTEHFFDLLCLFSNNNNNDDRLTAFDPGQPG